MKKTEAELRAWRERTLDKTPLSGKELKERGESFQLYGRDSLIYDTLKGIDYLLGED